MKLFRYRKPSLKTALGLTRAKKQVKKALGITQATRPLRAATNFERRMKRKLGYYSLPAQMARHGRPPTPFGCAIFLAVILTGLIAGIVLVG